MFPLILAWFCMGILIGVLVDLAHLRLASRSLAQWFTLPALGSIAALCGGLLAIAFLGRYFASTTALWFAILVTVLACNRMWVTEWVKRCLAKMV